MIQMQSNASNFAIFFVAAALFVELTVSGNMLTCMGVPYISEGGPLVVKIHPGSYFAAVAMLVHVTQGAPRVIGICARMARNADIALFLGAMSVCVFYAALLNGPGGVITLIDTFLPAGMIAFVLADAVPRQLAMLGRLLAALFLLNSVIAIGEAACGGHLVPLPHNGPELPDDFRPTALYDHPLTGAAATMLAVLLWHDRASAAPSRWIYGAVMFAALLAFGGRVALLLAILATAGLYLRYIALRALYRRVVLRDVIPGLTVATLGMPAGIIALGSGMAERLQTHLYWDPSAQARVHQFAILGLMNGDQLLFGCRRDDLVALIEPLRLNYGVDVIENFWLLLFATLGLLCFPVFLLGFAALMRFLWRSGDARAKLMVVVFVIATSASNSLGRKSNLLVTLTACVAASGGGWRGTARYQTVPARPAFGVA